MKKILTLFAAVLSFCCFSQSEATSSVEVRSAAFFPSISKFQKIYGDVQPCYSLEFNRTFCHCYQLWFNIDEMYASGNVQNCGETNLNVLTFSLGPKYIFPLSCRIDFYTGVGVAVAWSRINNDHTDKEFNTSVGLVVKFGTHYYLSDTCFLDAFCDYHYQPAFHKHVDVGGFKLGLGIGRQF